MRIPYKRQQGQVLIMVALSAIVLIASIGLAVDSGLGYLVKAKLNSAVDSASLAAARAVTQGTTEEAQAASARQAAKEFFDINFPSNYMMSTPVLKPVVVTFDKVEKGKIIIDVSATATLPVSLMGVLGFQTLNVAASAQTIRKDLDMILVMDTSGSLKPNEDAVRLAGKSFLNKFNSTVDRVGLLHFASDAQIDVSIGTNRGFSRTNTEKAITGYTFAGGTNSAEGLWQARKQLNDNIKQADRSSLRVIVFFSDGSPAAFSSYFPNTGNKCKTAGALATFTKLQSPALDGLYKVGVTNTDQSGDCDASKITELPKWYNANDSLQEFEIITNTPRVVTKAVDSAQIQWTNVHRASRNLAEAIANKARAEGVYIFTLGMGASLTAQEGPDKEYGQDLLRCLANTVDAPSRCRKSTQPVGLYCYAATESDLSPCFTRLASAILRISK